MLLQSASSPSRARNRQPLITQTWPVLIFVLLFSPERKEPPPQAAGHRSLNTTSSAGSFKGSLAAVHAKKEPNWEIPTPADWEVIAHPPLR